MGSKFGISLQRTKSAIVLTEICLEKKKKKQLGLLWISNVVKSCGLIFWTQFISFVCPIFSDTSIDFLSHYRLIEPAKIEPFGRSFVVEDEDHDCCLNYEVRNFL